MDFEPVLPGAFVISSGGRGAPVFSVGSLRVALNSCVGPSEDRGESQVLGEKPC